MNILALEFSAPERSVAIARKAGEGHVTVIASIRESDFRDVTGMMLVDRALQEARVKPAGISLIAVGLGPGSYTGIRSAIAIAQGWQLGRDIEIVGIGSDLVLAETARARGLQGEITIIVDAQRGDVYTARYVCEAEACREVATLKILPGNQIPAAGTIVGPEARKFVATAIDLAPAAEMLAILAARSALRTPAEKLEPIYLRETAFVKAAPVRNIP